MSDIEEINISISEAKKKVALKNSLDRLTQDPNFERVILNGYFKEHAARLVMLRADPGMESAARQESLLRAIDAVGELQQYFRGVIQLGLMAEKSLQEDEQTRQEILGEE